MNAFPFEEPMMPILICTICNVVKPSWPSSRLDEVGFGCVRLRLSKVRLGYVDSVQVGLGWVGLGWVGLSFRLGCIILCYAALCYIMLHHVVLCCVVLGRVRP
jgi:hypothetical protein